ncbi:MAG: hypothetical protein PHP87_07125 [Syntrophomonas sp.]|uniref:hypothetical protein n=1 Tax=Syntrophomonas sp. TaxID=2053627 RepID=UPI0026052842|nr:hypothetical protein [Syntrophomonas sp.]MDD4626844.1 hypothetical protein [Syntrophomonas sp.]
MGTIRRAIAPAVVVAGLKAEPTALRRIVAVRVPARAGVPEAPLPLLDSRGQEIAAVQAAADSKAGNRAVGKAAAAGPDWVAAAAIILPRANLLPRRSREPVSWR